MGRPPEVELKPKPALVFEVDPDAKTRKRSFVWLLPGTAVDYPGKLTYLHHYIDETTGAPFFLYEATEK